MKRYTTGTIFFMAFVLLAACGSPAATEIQASPPSVPTEPTAVATNTAAQIPTDTQAAPAAASTIIDIVLADNSIKTPLLTFQAGVPYTFVIVNNGRHAHNFNISTPVEVVGSMNAALSSALLKVPQDQLGAGETATVDFTFPASAVGSNLELSCLIRNHYEDGMHQEITVTP